MAGVSLESLFFLSAVVLGSGVAGLCWRFADRAGVGELGVAAGAIALFGVSALVDGIYPLGDWAWLVISNLLFAPVSVALLVFVLRYTGQDDWLTTPLWTVIVLVLVSGPALALTNPWHHLLVAADGGSRPLWWVTLFVRYGLLTIATFLLLRSLVVSRHQYRGQVTALTVGLVVPFLTNVLLLTTPALGLPPVADLVGVSSAAINAGVFAFGLASVAVGVHRSRLLDLIPATREVARDELIERMDDGVFAVDAQRRIADVNPAGGAVVGQSPPDVIGSPLSEVLPGLEPLLDRGEDVYEEIARQEDGEIVYYAVQVTPLSTGAEGVAGVESGWLVDVRDVTDRRRRRLELERYETIVEVLGEMVYSVDEDGRLTFVNHAAEAMLGRPPEDLLGTEFEAFVDDATRDRARDTVQGLLADEGRPAGTVEGRLITADGGRRPVEISIALLPAEDGDFRGSAGVVRDVSEREQRKRRLQVLNRVLRHNLRNEMTVIRGSVEHVREQLDDPDLTEWLDTATDQARDLEAVGERARDIEEAIESTARDPHPVDAVGLAETVVATHRDRYPTATIRIDCPDEATVLADETLEHVLANLVENGIEHNDRAAPTVTVSIHDPDVDDHARPDAEDLIAISVADDGPGIPDEERQIITGETEITALQHGSGLGLWMVTLITETLGGELAIDCPDDGGTVVTIRLPRG